MDFIIFYVLYRILFYCSLLFYSIRLYSVRSVLFCSILVWTTSLCYECELTKSHFTPTNIDSSWNVIADGDTREGKWRENWRWSGQPVPFSLPRNMVYPVLLPLMCTPRLPVVDCTDAPADLNGLVRFAERRNLVSARVPSLTSTAPKSTTWSVWKSRVSLKAA
jgi:hypothetical protein